MLRELLDFLLGRSAVAKIAASQATINAVVTMETQRIETTVNDEIQSLSVMLKVASKRASDLQETGALSGARNNAMIAAQTGMHTSVNALDRIN